MGVYEDMAEVYDLIYGDTYDLGFYLNEARNARGPVLEVACGTGRILLRLIKEGVPACGIDSSRSMLDILRKKASILRIEPDARLFDMRDFDLGKVFRLIIVPYRSFLHLPDEEGRRKALSCFFRHLAQGGRLILHLYNPSEPELARRDDFELIESESAAGFDGGSVRLDWHLRYDPDKRKARYRIELKEEDSPQKSFEMDIHFLGKEEIRSLLKTAGFKNIRVYGGFDYEAFNDESREAVWIAER